MDEWSSNNNSSISYSFVSSLKDRMKISEHFEKESGSTALFFHIEVVAKCLGKQHKKLDSGWAPIRVMLHWEAFLLKFALKDSNFKHETIPPQWAISEPMEGFKVSAYLPEQVDAGQ